VEGEVEFKRGVKGTPEAILILKKRSMALLRTFKLSLFRLKFADLSGEEMRRKNPPPWKKEKMKKFCSKKIEDSRILIIVLRVEMHVS